jgi:hypothetical protein
MITTLIQCPYCGGTSPADARFCIECSAQLKHTAISTTYRLAPPPQLTLPQPPPIKHHTVPILHILVGIAGALLLGTLLLLSILADRNPRFDTAARLVLIVGGIQLVRFVCRGLIIAGLRAAVICLGLVLAMATPWMLTAAVLAGAALLALHLLEAFLSNRHKP